jgi:hypothetical protein
LPAKASALWVFNLHYHEWLADLRVAGLREEARARTTHPEHGWEE